MSPQQVIDHFGGTQQAAADALGVTQVAVSQWLAAGRVPELRQYQVYVRSGGKLAIDDPMHAEPAAT